MPQRLVLTVSDEGAARSAKAEVSPVGAGELPAWILVTVQAPTHRQRLRRVNRRHQIDSTMALHAAHSSSDVRGVVEVNKLR